VTGRRRGGKDKKKTQRRKRVFTGRRRVAFLYLDLCYLSGLSELRVWAFWLHHCQLGTPPWKIPACQTDSCRIGRYLPVGETSRRIWQLSLGWGATTGLDPPALAIGRRPGAPCPHSNAAAESLVGGRRRGCLKAPEGSSGWVEVTSTSMPLLATPPRSEFHKSKAQSRARTEAQQPWLPIRNMPSFPWRPTRSGRRR
jgi:hypothetical protein